jgi:hypothetical protein
MSRNIIFVLMYHRHQLLDLKPQVTTKIILMLIRTVINLAMFVNSYRFPLCTESHEWYAAVPLHFVWTVIITLWIQRVNGRALAKNMCAFFILDIILTNRTDPPF